MRKEIKKVPTIRFRGFTEDWEQRKVSEIGNIITGSTPKTSISDNYGGEFLFVSPADIQGNRYVDETITTLTKKGFDQGRKIREGASLFVSIGSTIGKVAQTSQESTTNQQINAVEPYDNFDDDFIFTLLENISGSIKSIASNQAVPIVNKTTFGETEIQVPSELAEQQKIGAYFRNLDHLITLHQRKFDELKTAKTYFLQNMFPAKGEKVPRIRFHGFTGDWEQRKLGEIITEYKETVDSDCTLPILTSSKTEGVILQEEHFGRKQQHDITGYNILPRNYCTYRNRSDGVDFTFNINKCCAKGIISKFYPVFSGKNSNVFFLSLVLNNSDEVVREIAYTCTGTGQKVLSFLDLQKMKVTVPSFDEQKEIAACFEQFDHLITLHQHKLDQLKTLKKFMLQNLFI